MEDPVFSLSLQECNLVANIIDTCSKRGAFRPNEFGVVGGFFDKLFAFIKENSPEEPAPTE